MLQWSTTKYMLISKLTKLQLTSLPQACCRPFERSTTWGDFSRIWVHNWLSATLREDRVWANFVTFRQGSWREKKKQFFYYLSNRNYTTTALQTDTFHQSMICTSITETLHFSGLRLSDWTPKFCTMYQAWGSTGISHESSITHHTLSGYFPRLGNN